MKLIIDAREIEQALARHPMVAAAAVIGTADDATGRRAKAFVVIEENGSAEQFLSGLSGRLVPNQIRFGTSLPEMIGRNGAGTTGAGE